MKTLTELFQKNQSCPDRGIHIFDTQNYDVSYAEFSRRVLRFLNALDERLSTKTVVLYCDALYPFLRSFWALVLGRYVPVPLTTSMTDEHVRKLELVFERLDAPNVLTDRSTAQKLSEHFEKTGKAFDVLRNRIVLIEDVEEAQSEREAKIVVPDPDDCAFIQFSSGSTGDPKGVVLSHRNLLTNVAAIVRNSNAAADSRSLSWMPLTHDMGLIGFHLSPYWMAIDQWLMSVNQFIRNPLCWLDRIEEHRITQTASPNFGLSYVLRAVARKPEKTWDLSSLRLIFCGAEPIALDICQEFLLRLEPHRLKPTTLFPVYGLAEASLAVSFPEPETVLRSIRVRRDFSWGKSVTLDERDGLAFVSVGKPVADCEYRLVADSEVVPEDVVGEIQIRGDNVTKGYYGDEIKTRESFDDPDWFKTGDLGFVHRGALFVVGRLKDVFFVNGQNYLFFDVERVLEEIEEIGAGRCALVAIAGDGNEKIAAFVVFKKPAQEFVPLYRAVQDTVSRKFGFHLDEILPVPSIPRTTSGKLQRFKLVKAYRSGEFDEVSKRLNRVLSSQKSISREEIRTQMRGLLESEFGIRLGWDDPFMESGIESIKLAEILTRTESLFSAKLSIADYFNFPTIDSLSSWIYGKHLSIGRIPLPVERRRNLSPRHGQFETQSLEATPSDPFTPLDQGEISKRETVALAFFSYLLGAQFALERIPVHTLRQKIISCRSIGLDGVSGTQDLFSAVARAEVDYELPLNVWSRLSIDSEEENVVAIVCERSSFPEASTLGAANLILTYRLESSQFELIHRSDILSGEEMANLLSKFVGGWETFIRQTVS